MTVPLVPTLLAPIGSVPATSGISYIGLHNDPDGDALNAVQIEVRRVSDNSLVALSSMITGATFDGNRFEVLAVAWSLQPVGGFPVGVDYKWRAKTRDATGSIGAWSSFVTFRRAYNDPPTAAIIAPLDGATVGTLTPTLQGQYTAGAVVPGGTPYTFGSYQIQVRRKSDQVSFWDMTSGASTQEQSSNQFNRVYAGTALSAGTAYEWRCRVYDGQSWSAYNGWATFTPAIQPETPTGLTPSGLANTLTPSITGTYNQGAGSTEAAFQYEIRLATTTIYQSGDVSGTLATGQAYGTNNPSDTPSSPPALSWGTTYQIRVRSKDALGVYSEWSAWQNFNTNAAPTSPTPLSPVGITVGDTTPRLRWRHNDADSDAQTAVDIELRKVSDDSAVTGYDPKSLTQSDEFHDVTETLTDSPATAYKWRARTKGLAGPGFGAWSAFSTFTVAQAPSVEITSPAEDDVLAAPAFTVEWTYSGGNPQQDYQVLVLDANGATVHDSGVVGGTDLEYNVPAGALKNASGYTVRLVVHDTAPIEAQAQDVHITTSWTAPDALTGLLLQTAGGDGIGLPSLYLTWDESALDLDTFLSYIVYWRVFGDSEWLRIARIRAKTTLFYTDYTIASDTVYEYALAQDSDVAGEPVESDLVTASGSHSFRLAYLHDVDTPDEFVALPSQWMQVTVHQDIALLQPWGRQTPTAHIGETEARVATLSQIDAWDGGSATWTGALALVTRQRTVGALLCLRQRRNGRMFCQVMTSFRRDDVSVFTQQIELQETYYEEGVD